MTRARASMLAALLLPGAAAGCRPELPCERPQIVLRTKAITEPDGRLALYHGERIVTEGPPAGEDDGLPGPTFVGATFLRIRLPPALLDALPVNGAGYRALSLETPTPGVDLLFHRPVPSDYYDDERGCERAGAFENLTVRPGDPWVSGWLWIGPLDREPLSFGVEMKRHARTVPFGSEQIRYGAGDGCRRAGECPPLLYYESDPCTWPPVPPSWSETFVPARGVTAADDLCRVYPPPRR